MTKLTLERIADKVDYICDRNNSWAEDRWTAVVLHALNGDWEHHIDWMTEAVIETYGGGGYDFFEAGVKLSVTRYEYDYKQIDLSSGTGRLSVQEVMELAEAFTTNDPEYKLTWILAGLDNEYLEYEESTLELIDWALTFATDSDDIESLKFHQTAINEEIA